MQFTPFVLVLKDGECTMYYGALKLKGRKKDIKSKTTHPCI
jgi:hypothetical protein